MNGTRFNIIRANVKVVRYQQSFYIPILTKLGLVYIYLLINLVNACGIWNSTLVKSITNQGISLSKQSIVGKGLIIGLNGY